MERTLDANAVGGPATERVLLAVARYHAEHGHTPTYRQITTLAHVGLGTVPDHIGHLEHAGLLSRVVEDGKTLTRTLRITPKGLEVVRGKNRPTE